MARKKSAQRNKKQKEGKLDKYFLFTGRKLVYLLLVFIGSVILHNLIYALFYDYYSGTGGDEPFFFIIAVIIIPLYFLIMLIYTLVKKIRDKTIFQKDFIIRVLIAIILGVIVSYLIILFTFVNLMGFWMLSVVFSFIMYYLIKLIKRR